MKCNRCFNELLDSDLICSTCGRFSDNVGRVPREAMKGLRVRVLDVVVRQAMINSQWRELCDLAMQVNHISIAEVRSEIRRRGGELHAPTAALRPRASLDKRHHVSTPSTEPAHDRLYQMRNLLGGIGNGSVSEVSSLRAELAKITTEMEAALHNLNAELIEWEYRRNTSGIEFRRAAAQFGMA